jgi:protein tyrosine/serine phosphatase
MEDNSLDSFGLNPITIFGLDYPSPKHAYLAAKYLIYNLEGQIVETPAARHIRLTGQIPKLSKTNTRWNINKYNIARYIIYTTLTKYNIPLTTTLTYFFTSDNNLILETLSVLENRLMPLAPTSNSNWNIPNRLLSSATPTSENIKNLVRHGINVIINLRERNDPVETTLETHLGFQYSIDPYGKYTTFHLPIHDHKITSDSHIIRMAMLVIHLIGLNQCVMVHCHAGKGRTGTLISLVLGILYGINKDQAIDMITRHFKLRIDKGYHQILHITSIQLEQIDRILTNNIQRPGIWLI